VTRMDQWLRMMYPLTFETFTLSHDPMCKKREYRRDGWEVYVIRGYSSNHFWCVQYRGQVIKDGGSATWENAMKKATNAFYAALKKTLNQDREVNSA
jgi:hypothetical protein